MTCPHLWKVAYQEVTIRLLPTDYVLFKWVVNPSLMMVLRPKYVLAEAVPSLLQRGEVGLPPLQLRTLQRSLAIASLSSFSIPTKFSSWIQVPPILILREETMVHLLTSTPCLQLGDRHQVVDCTIGSLVQAIDSVAYLRDALAWSRCQEERAAKEPFCIRCATPTCTGRCLGDSSKSGRPISKAGLRYDIAYLKGCLEVEQRLVDSLRTDMWVLRGRPISLSSHAVKVERR